MFSRQRALSADEWNDAIIAFEYYVRNSSVSEYKKHCKLGSNIETVSTPSQGYQNKTAFPLPENSTYTS